MTGRGKYRESELPDVPPGLGGHTVDGRRCISVIGIDQYRTWDRLDNAVNDARGVLAAFEQHGFVSIAAPLLNDAATGDALRRLPGSLKLELGRSDSLVVFFAGHGHTVTDQIPDGYSVSTGYLIPVDADRTERGAHTWEGIDNWLTAIARLPARHILVILDSCHSGIALSRSVQHRGLGVRTDGASVPVYERLSRRVLTSAADDQRAMDGGPIAGHSVFTGYLIEALRRSSSAWQESSAVGVRDIAEYVRRRVQEFSGFTQVPDMGVLEFHDSGELFLSLGRRRAVSAPSRTAPRGTHAARPQRADVRRPPTVDRPPSGSPASPRSPVSTPERRPTIPAQNRPATIAPPPSGETGKLAERIGQEHPSAIMAQSPDEASGLPDRTEGWTLAPAIAAALDRHGEERRRGAHVLTIVAGDAMAARTSWGTWAARHGYLTLATRSVGVDAVVTDLLAQTPWLRCVPEARKRLATAAQIDALAVDASLDARSPSERRTWVDDVARLDPHARVSGWLLSWVRGSNARVPDPTTAPARPGELLAIACDLASPTAVLLFHPTPDERWLERAVVTAAELIAYLPAHSVAVTAPEELVRNVLRDHRQGMAWAMARQGVVSVAPLGQRLPGRARHSTMRVLFDALARDPRTRGRFQFDSKVVAKEGPAIDVALVAHSERIAVELDAWYHFHDPEGYRRDRVQDARLQRAGYFVLRFPAEDVDDRLASTIEHLAIALAGRRAARALP
jgi:very-short-patch-repair endonuclease